MNPCVKTEGKCDESVAEVRQDSLHFDSVMNPTHYETISVT